MDDEIKLTGLDKNDGWRVEVPQSQTCGFLEFCRGRTDCFSVNVGAFSVGEGPTRTDIDFFFFNEEDSESKIQKLVEDFKKEDGSRTR